MDANEKNQLNAVTDYIMLRLGEPLRIGDLCHVAMVNRNKLAGLFRMAYGCSVFDYIKSCRMEKARELLLNSELTIKDITAAVGYCHSTNFLIAYKRYHGCTAGATRKTARK